MRSSKPRLSEPLRSIDRASFPSSCCRRFSEQRHSTDNISTAGPRPEEQPNSSVPMSCWRRGMFFHPRLNLLSQCFNAGQVAVVTGALRRFASPSSTVAIGTAAGPRSMNSSMLDGRSTPAAPLLVEWRVLQATLWLASVLVAWAVVASCYIVVGARHRSLLSKPGSVSRASVSTSITALRRLPRSVCAHDTR